MTFRTVEQYEALVAEQAQQIERLRALVKAAYIEGWDNSSEEHVGDIPMAWWDDWWPKTKTYAALQPKEGEQ